MSDEQSQEELLEQQKANCIFCKIVKGDVPGKRVYEDDVMLAILDIRPAVKGHTLVLPKEHYPIMPLIPPEEFRHLFGTTAQLSGTVRRAMIAERCTTFIANGAVAGQQSPHFLFHLIPRESGDGLTNFAIPTGSVDQSDISAMLRQNLQAVMQQHLQRYPLTTVPPATKEETMKEMTKETRETQRAPLVERGEEDKRRAAHAPAAMPATPTALNIDYLAQIIDQTPELKALLINNPEKLEQILTQNPQLQPLFAGVDVQKLGEQLRQQFLAEKDKTPDVTRTESEEKEGRIEEERPTQEARKSVTEEKAQQEASPEEEASNPAADDLIPATAMTLPELFAFIEEKPKLQALILEEPERLKAMIPGNERLSRFFAGSDVDAIIQAYRAYARGCAESGREKESKRERGRMRERESAEHDGEESQ